MQGIAGNGSTALVDATDGERAAWFRWTGADGPPVPVLIPEDVLRTLGAALAEPGDLARQPRVFRLFMPRGNPREVTDCAEIEEVWLGHFETIRWREGGYPPTTEALRKGGNAFLRGDVEFQLRDAWWMGREQTDLRLLAASDPAGVRIGAWWARAGASGELKHSSDGDVWPVRLIVCPK